MDRQDPRELAASAIRASLGGDPDGFLAHATDDYTERYPQSREEVPDPAALRRLLSEHPTPPRLAQPMRATTLGEDRVAVESVADYGESRWWLITLFDIRGGRLAHERAYFGRPLEAQDWRREWVVPIPSDEPPPDPGGHGGVSRDVAERYFTAQASSDLAMLSRLRHPEFVHDMPQSGERFPSADAYAAAHRHYPGGLPVLRPLVVSGPDDQWVVGAGSLPLRVSGSGPHWVGEAELLYPDGERWFEILFMDFRDGKVIAERSYWADPFEPPAWRDGITRPY